MEKLVVFDWNGTLLDDAHANFEGANAALKALGIPPITLDHYRKTFDFPIIHFYHRNGVDADIFLERVKDANNAFFPTYERLEKTCSLRSGAKDLLEWVRFHEVTCIILSNHVIESISWHLDRFALRDYFHTLSCNPHDNDVLTSTNKQKRLEQFMTDNRLLPENVLIIGDSLEEPQIGKNLGISSVSISGGCISKERLEKAGADHYIDELPELQPILVKTWGLSI